MIKIKITKEFGEVKAGEIVTANEVEIGYKVWHHTGIWAIPREYAELIEEEQATSVTDKYKHENACEIKFVCSTEEKGCCVYRNERHKPCVYCGNDFPGRCHCKVAQVNAAVLFLKKELDVENIKNILKSMMEQEGE
jgi:hypothetical protein